MYNKVKRMRVKRLSKLAGLFLGVTLAIGVGVSFSREKPQEVEAATYNQTVNEYYSSINWDQTGATLKTALYNKIKISTAGWSYDGLWTAYKTTDVRPDGTHFWDIYSDTTMYTLNDDRINASYKKEGDSINREHVIPQSSFNEAAPMKSDVHHVLPSDGYVNNRRSAYPHGIVTGSPTYTSNDGCKLGSGTGSSTVFEPMDNYKGDIARIYLYFVTCYENKMSSNSFSAFDKSTYPSIKSAYLNVYLQWCKDDPVSQKEIDRNNAAYAGQGNRNPFIDCPYAVGAIWDSSHASDYGVKGQYTSGEGVSLSKTSASMISGGSTTISATSTGGGTINWTASNSSVVSLSSNTSSSGSNITLTAGSAGSATITASTTISGQTYSQTCSVTVAATKQVSSIAISGYKTSFVLDDTFSFGGVVTATYNDGTTADVTSNATFSGYNMSTSGTQTVTVSYSYGGATKTATYEIKIKTSGGSGEQVTADIDFTGSKSSDTDSKGNVWSTTGDFTKGSSYLRLNSSDTYISNEDPISMDPNEDISVTANLRTYGGVSSQSLKIAAYNSSGTKVSNILTLSPTDSTLREYSGTFSFTSFTDTDITIKAYSGNNNSLGISGMSITYTETSSTPKILDEIEVSTFPTKTSYDVGECFDPTGLVISRTYTDGTFDTYTYAGHTTEFTFVPSPITPLTIDDDTIEIIHGGESCFFEIDIEYPRVLSSITISGYTTTFTEGDTFAFGGTVTANYEDGSHDDVTTAAIFSGYNMANVGNQTVTVTFEGKTQQYGITVSAGALSSIAVSGQTTSFVKNGSFSFDGVCTATFANGYQKAVTPTSVTSPDMSTTGSKTITVSYTYNGNTRTTSYSITVNSYRTVMEDTESLLATITFPDNTETISGNVTTEKVTYYAFESNAIRLGSGSATGSITVNSSTSNIYRVSVSAKSYGSDTSVNLSIGGTGNTITSSYQNYGKSYSTPVNSVTIATTANKKRAYVQSITVYTMTSQDIGQTADCVGLEDFINDKMHMEYVDYQGWCKDTEHNYYGKNTTTGAKYAFNQLNDHQRKLFTTNSAYAVEWERLQYWAAANDDVLNTTTNTLVASGRTNSVMKVSGDNMIALIVIISLVGLTAVGGYIYLKRRKEY